MYDANIDQSEEREQEKMVNKLVHHISDKQMNVNMFLYNLIVTRFLIMQAKIWSGFMRLWTH